MAQARMDENLKEYYDALETLFATADCGIMCHSVDGKHVITINHAALKILGYQTKEELLQDGFLYVAQTVLVEDKPKVRKAIQSLKKVGDSTGVSYRVRHKDGELIDIMGTVKLLEKNGERVYQRFLFDYTSLKQQQKKKQRATEKRYNEMIQALAMDYTTIYFLNLDTGIGYPYRLNDQMIKRYADVFDGNMELKSCMELYARHDVHEEDKEMFLQSTTQINLKNELQNKHMYQFRYRTYRNQTVEYFELKAVRVGTWSDKKHNAVVGFREVTDEVFRDMEQKKLLEDALVRAEHASQAKTTFLSNMSHDIRTPMNAVIGFASLAMNCLDDRDKIEDYLGKILVSGRHLLSLINDVLDMSRIEGGRLEIQMAPSALRELINDMETVIDGQAKAKGISLYTEMDESKEDVVLCDKLRVSQILLNLVGNAVKFTPSGGRIDVSLKKTGYEPEMGKATYQIRVRDNGIGMKKEFQKHIFEPFAREQTSTVSKLQGTGLGLAITKNLVDMMGGMITVCSEEGVGTDITVTLHFAVIEREGILVSDKKRKNTDALKGKRILLTEDNEMNREIATELLTMMGFVVEEAAEGEEAVKKFSESSEMYYDMILMDIQMPVMNGYEATRRIRAMERPDAKKVPVFAMTANAFAEDVQEAKNAGMNRHLAKPLMPEQLKEELETWFMRN
jgi:PAS domain S-box-containing protein